jgi:hypothetical protein
MRRSDSNKFGRWNEEKDEEEWKRKRGESIK